MKSKLLYSLAVLLFFSCKPRVVTLQKTKLITVHTFTGKGEHEKETTWFYIKDVADGGFSGYYFESTTKVDDFKKAQFKSTAS